MEIKQNTSTNAMILMIDSTDHISGKTALSLDVTVSKDGSGFFPLSSGATISEVSKGWYTIKLTANETNILGDLILHAEAVGADPSDRSFLVVPQASAIISAPSITNTASNTTSSNPITASKKISSILSLWK
jgi:hypothetical protein